MSKMWRACIAGLIAVAAPLPASVGQVVNTERRPHAAVRTVQLDDVRWTDGFWADRFATNRDRSIPAMWEIMRGTQYKPFLQHFLIAAGDLPGDYHGAAWNDGDFYKFLEACSATYAVSSDPALLQILDQSIDAIGRAQREDGYLHTPVLIRQRNGDLEAKPFTDRHNFEMYNMGHLITSACLHHRVTGSDKFLAIAKRAADFLCETFQDPTPSLAQNSVCPSHYMAMVELYRTTREPRYLELANTFFEMRNLVTSGGDDNQDRIPFIDQREAAGHAVRANYLYAGAADMYLETGDEDFLAALVPIWESVVRRKMYLTGGCGALYDGASPDGSADQTQIARVHQAYGRNYQLPNTTAHNETCAAVGSVLWNWRMFLATGDAKYVDVLELALYNAVLSGVSLDGTSYFYTNPLRQVDPLPTELRWSRTRVPFIVSYCCPPNVVRTIAEVNGCTYSMSDDAVWINLYGGSTLSTTWMDEPLKLSQVTKYPWDGDVRIALDECPETAFSLKLRIPGWAESASLRVNGTPVNSPITPGTYVGIRRRWKPGDSIELKLPMPARLIEAHPLVEELRNQVAIERGPLVYCLESPDLSNGVHVEDIIIPRDTALTARHEPGLLGGVTVVEAEAKARPSGDWEGKLYRPLNRSRERKIRARLVPYYAWSNRGPSEMSVWLPAQ